MRWLFHLLRVGEAKWDREERYRPRSLESEGFVHASFKDEVAESARLHFRGVGADELSVLAIDPRRLDVPVRLEATPRGPMPHVYGSIPKDAVRELDLGAIDGHPDRVTGTRLGFAAFEGMTLLDLVGPLDGLSRIASMAFDETTSCEVFALTRMDERSPALVWSALGLEVRAARYRPSLDEFDVVVVPGGLSTRSLARDAEVAAYLSTFPSNRLMASVCTGALLLGAAGRLRGKPATTHRSALGQLAEWGAAPRSERVVDAGSVVTAGGVTAGVDLGIHLVRRLEGDEVADAIAKQMETEPSAPGAEAK